MLKFVCKVRKPTQSELLSLDVRKTTSKSKHVRSRSKSPSGSRDRSFGAKSSMLENYKFSIFSPLEWCSKVVALEDPLLGKQILKKYSTAESLEQTDDNAMIGEPITFDFDTVIDENFRKDKLYTPHVKDIVNRSLKGEDALVIIFGPSEEHKNGLLKYTNSKEKGMLGRAIEDILQFRDMYGYNKLSIVLNAYQIYLENVEDLLGLGKGIKHSSNKPPQIVTSLNSETNEHFDSIINLTDKNLNKSKDIITVVQEISKNREKFAKNLYALSNDEMKRRSHLVVILNLHTDYGKPTEEKLSEITFIELWGSEQATASTISKDSKSMSDKEFASKSFNSISHEIVNSSLKSSKKKQSDETSSIISRIWKKYLRNSYSNNIFVCKVSPDASKFKHSLTAIKFAAKLHEVIRKKIKLTLPEEPVQNPELLQTLSSRQGTYAYDSAEKSNPNTYSDRKPELNQEELDEHDNNSEILSNYITETDQSQFKSQEILNYLISDFAEFLSKQQTDSKHSRVSRQNQDEWFEECQEKITHIEDIIKRLPDETKYDFMNSSQSQQLKKFMEIVRNKRKDYMLTLCNNEPGIFDKDRVDSKSSTYRSNRKDHSLESHQRMSLNKKDNSTMGGHSTDFPQSKFEGSHYKNKPVFEDDIENTAPNKYYDTKHSDIVIHSSSVKNDTMMSYDNNKLKQLEEKYKEYNIDGFTNSLPPPHPSKISNRKSNEVASTSKNHTNRDLKLDYQSKEDFLTVGRNSNVYPSMGTGQIFNETDSSYFPTMSKQSQKIVEYYKTQSEKESRKWLDESYESSKSKSNEDNDHREDSLQNSLEYNPINELGPFDTARTDRLKEMRLSADMINSPDMYSTGRLFDQIEAEHKQRHIQNNSVQIQNALQNQLSVIEEKSSNFKDMMRQYIEKCRVLEEQLQQKESLLSEFRSETNTMNENFEKLKDEMIKYQTENQSLKDSANQNEAEISQLTINNKSLTEKLQLSDEYINELKATLNSEKNFNIKVADNLAQQTQETSKLKQMEADHSKEISTLHSQIERLDETIQSKNEKLADLQNERMADLKTIKELKETINNLEHDNQKLENQLEGYEKQNSEYSKKLLEKTKDLSELDDDLTSKDEHIKKLKSEIMHLKDKADVLDIKNRELVKINQELESGNFELQSKLTESINKKQHLQEELEQIEDENNKYNLEISDRLSQYEDMKKQLDQAHKLIQQKEDDIIVLKAREYDSVYHDGQLDDIKLKYKKLEDERAKLEIQLDKSEKEKKILQQQKNDIQEEMHYLQVSQGERIDDLDMKFQNLLQDHKTVKDQNHELKEQELELKREINLLEKARDNFRDEYLELKKQFRDEKQRIQQTEEHFRDILDQKDQELENMKNLRVTVNEETNQKSKMVNDIQSLIKQYREANRSKK